MPIIDALLNVEDDDTVLNRYNLKTPFLVLQHPVTTGGKSESQILETLEAISKFKDHDTLFILPNNDGHKKLLKKLKLVIKNM